MSDSLAPPNTLPTDMFTKVSTKLTMITSIVETISDRLNWNVLGNVAFTVIVWTVHTLSICNKDVEVCKKSWIVGTPFAMLTEDELEDFLVQYVWLYIAISLLYQVIVHGIPRTSEDAARATRRETNASTGYTEKCWLYLYHVFSFGYRHMLQPWVIFQVAMEVGRIYGIGVTHGALLSIYTALGLRLLMFFCAKLDQLSCSRGLTVLDLTFWLLTGMGVALALRSEHLDPVPTLVQASWEGARKYSNTARIAEENLRRRAAGSNTT